MPVRAVPLSELVDAPAAERSTTVRRRVEAARARARRRGVCPDFGPRGASSDPAVRRLLEDAHQRLGLSARAHVRVLRVARTIADLAGARRVAAEHVAEAIQYRALDRFTARVSA